MSRTVIQVLTDAYIAYRGKSSNMPASGTSKYNDMLAILNRKQREWWSDPNTDWPSLFALTADGTVTSGTQTYALPATLLRLSDYIILQDSNLVNKYITVVKPAQRAMYSSGCYVYDSNPMMLTFITTIDSNLTGLNLIVPGYIAPVDLVNMTDIVAVDDPNWLVYSVASELARNDYSKEEQFPNLNGIANALYQQMVDDAFANSQLQPNGVPNVMPQPNSYTGVPGATTNGYGGIF